MVGKDASARPTIQEIMDHPYLKEPEEELDYMVKFIAKYKRNQDFIAALNRDSVTANLFAGDWRSFLSASVNNKLDVGTYRPYQGTSVFHLVKAIRDKVLLDIIYLISSRTHHRVNCKSIFHLAVCAL